MGYSNNTNDRGWILGRGNGVLMSVFAEPVRLVGYDAYVSYCGRRSSEWTVEASVDGETWVEVHRSAYDNEGRCGWFSRRW